MPSLLTFSQHRTEGIDIDPFVVTGNAADDYRCIAQNPQRQMIAGVFDQNHITGLGQHGADMGEGLGIASREHDFAQLGADLLMLGNPISDLLTQRADTVVDAIGQHHAAPAVQGGIGGRLNLGMGQ